MSVTIGKCSVCGKNVKYAGLRLYPSPEGIIARCVKCRRETVLPNDIVIAMPQKVRS